MSILELLKKYGVETEEELKELLSSLSPMEKVELIQALEAASNYNFTQYVPQSYQRSLHLSPAYIRAMIAGNRTGKTWGCLHDLLWYITGKYPDWFPEALKRETPFFSRWIATDFVHGIGEVFQPLFKRSVPGPYKDGPYVKRITKTQQGVYTKIEWQNGSVISLMTDQQDLEEFEGWTGHRLDIDEPCGHSKYIASTRGLVDYKGRVCFHLTPLSEPWIYDDIYLKADGKKIFVVTASSYDNKYNNKEALEQFEEDMASDPDLREARIEGKFRHLKGLVYKGIDRDVHQISKFDIQPDYPIVHVLDPHDRKPHVHIWAAIDSYNRYYIVGEMEKHGTVLETSHAIKQFERDRGFHVSLRIGDPNKFKAPAAVGQTGSLKSEFGKYGLYFYTNVNDRIADGHQAVRKKLYWNKKLPRRLGNQPAMYFVKGQSDKCFNEMLRYIYYEEKDPDSRGLKEKPKEAHKDFPDVVRYLCMAAPEYENMDIMTHSEDIQTTVNETTGW